MQANTLSASGQRQTQVTHGITSRVMRALALGRPVRDFDRLPGGQGVVHHVRDGRARVIG